MPHEFTIGEVVEWILENRKNKVFRNMTKSAVLSRITNSCSSGGIILAINNDKIEGIIVYEPQVGNILYILHLLATTKQAFKHFAKCYQQYFRGWKLEADRRNKFIKYKNTQRLINLIQKI